MAEFKLQIHTEDDSAIHNVKPNVPIPIDGWHVTDMSLSVSKGIGVLIIKRDYDPLVDQDRFETTLDLLIKTAENFSASIQPIVVRGEC